jgi:microcin C transport system permease protein
MLAYAIRRLLFIIPTLFGIMLVNFFIVQSAPGGPVDQLISELKGTAVSSTARISGGGSDVLDSTSQKGIDPEIIAEIKTLYGFDKPPVERFFHMLWRYIQFDFGDSFFKDQSVISLILERMPVSISLGVWTTLLVYLISIPLGIKKAVKDGTPFDIWTSAFVFIGYAIPSFLFAVLLVVVFAGGSFFDLFPLRGLTSPDWETLSWPAKIIDYLWHMVLPITAMVIGGFASLTMLTKNAFLEEINKNYVITARAKGCTEGQIRYGHIFRNAMLIVIAGFPSAFISVLFTGSLLIEVIFSLNGLGLLGYDAALDRDYPVMFATLYIFTLMGLLLNLVGDLTYMLVDPRISFDGQEE